jgi:hypothetical protein
MSRKYAVNPRVVISRVQKQRRGEKIAPILIANVFLRTIHPETAANDTCKRLLQEWFAILDGYCWESLEHDQPVL